MSLVWVVSRFRLKAPPGISSSCISPLTSSGQRSRAHGRPNLRNRLHYRHNQEGNHESSYEHVVALEGKKQISKTLSSYGQNRSLKKKKKKKGKKRNAVPVHDMKVNGPAEAQIYSPTRWSALTPQPAWALGKEQPVSIEQGLGRARGLSGRFEQHTTLLSLPKNDMRFIRRPAQIHLLRYPSI